MRQQYETECIFIPEGESARAYTTRKYQSYFCAGRERERGSAKSIANLYKKKEKGDDSH